MKKIPDSKIEQYCCPVGSRPDQDLFDTAQWIGRSTDGVAEQKVEINKLLRDQEDK